MAPFLSRFRLRAPKTVATEDETKDETKDVTEGEKVNKSEPAPEGQPSSSLHAMLGSKLIARQDKDTQATVTKDEQPTQTQGDITKVVMYQLRMNLIPAAEGSLNRHNAALRQSTATSTKIDEEIEQLHLAQKHVLSAPRIIDSNVQIEEGAYDETDEKVMEWISKYDLVPQCQEAVDGITKRLEAEERNKKLLQTYRQSSLSCPDPLILYIHTYTHTPMFLRQPSQRFRGRSQRPQSPRRGPRTLTP